GYLYARRKGAGEKYLDALFEQAFEHTNDISSLAVLSRVAVKMGFDADAFIQFIENPANQSHIHTLTLAAKHNGVKGLPTYLVNGLMIQGALPAQEWETIIRSCTRPTLPLMSAVEKEHHDPWKGPTAHHLPKGKKRKKAPLSRKKSPRAKKKRPHRGK
ncbi:MAG: DsbA family protein, partial [archaeon]